MARSKSAFRVGRVRAFLRGRVWYLCYHECGQRRRPRVGPERQVAHEMAAQINAQLVVGAPAALSFEPVSIPELRRRWLDHHEQVLRSSVQTINRYRTATEHLLRFLGDVRSVQSASHFRMQHAEEFLRYLRTIQVAPNGHRNTQKRPLLDKGIQYILETCRSMFNYAVKRRHLSPYAENPFGVLELDRMPIENARPIAIFNAEQERAFLEACDVRQFPVFLTLMLTGLRPGELTHLLLPDDLDLKAGTLFVRNKPRLGWQVKTRNERLIPLVQPLVNVLRILVGCRNTGPAFIRRRWQAGKTPPLAGKTPSALELELENRARAAGKGNGQQFTRSQWLSCARTVWRDAGALKTDRIRAEFKRLTRRIGQPEMTCTKMLRHLFATCLQDANVDPLIRNELMGHSAGGGHSGTGLGMTAVYTHTRFETKRTQLECALSIRSSIDIAVRWPALHVRPAYFVENRTC